MRLRFVLSLILASICFSPAALPQGLTPKDITAAVNARLKDQILSLRHSVAASTLNYDEAGNLLGKPSPGNWALFGHLEVKNAQFDEGLLKIKGNRIALSFEEWAPNKTPKYIRTPDQLEIRIVVSKNVAFDPGRELKKAFSTATEAFPENVPYHWQRFLMCRLKGPTAGDCQYRATDSNTVKVGGNVREPRIRSQTNPSYNDVARQARLEGRVELLLIVDEQGHVSNIEIVKPLGLGLDERAVEAVKTWTFDPATREGVPVRVYIDVLVNFSMRP